MAGLDYKNSNIVNSGGSERINAQFVCASEANPIPRHLAMIGYSPERPLTNNDQNNHYVDHQHPQYSPFRNSAKAMIADTNQNNYPSHSQNYISSVSPLFFYFIFRQVEYWIKFLNSRSRCRVSLQTINLKAILPINQSEFYQRMPFLQEWILYLPIKI